MRSAIIAAAFAAGALAVPYEKRDMVTATDVEVVYVTDYYTVTADQAAATQNNAYAPHPHKHKHKHNGWSGWQPVSSAESSVQETTQETTPIATPSPTPSPTTVQTRAPSPTGSSGGGSSGGPSGSAGSSYSDIAVFHHNLHRSNHSAPDIAWDAGLEQSAQDIANTCIYAHNTQMDGGGYGQNIAAGVEPNNISAIITNLFYNGEVGWYTGLYGEANPDMSNFEHWGHFSQIVWKGTTHVGCATADCTGQGLANVGSNVQPYFTVCNYKSPGNYAGEYGDNVGEPLGRASANWNTGL